MQTIEIVILIINVISLSICGGLVFSLLTSTNRDESSRLFAMTSGAFTVWVALSLIRFVSLSFGIDDVSFVQINLNLLMSALFAAGAFYFSFMVRHAQLKGTVFDILNVVIVVGTIAGVVLIWLTSVFTVRSDAIFEYSTSSIGFILFGFIMGYMLVSFWLMLNAPTERSSTLLRPTLLLFLAYVVASLDIWTFVFGIDVLLISVAAGLIGFTMLRRQVANPQAALNRDLQLTNQELQRTIHDLAQEKDKTEALNIELIQANRYKDEFLSTMSHELRTPLNSIVGYSELLMTNMYGELDEKQLDRLQRIHNNGRHLTNVINAILDLNKIDSGRMQLVVEDFSLIDLIQELGQKCAPDTDSVDFVIELPDDIPIYHGDRTRISQVLEIILDNAFKFTTDGHVKITLNHTVVSQGKSASVPLPTLGWLKDGQWAVIDINDTGTGIAPKDQARIFDRFSQADSSRTREHDGIGLGLTIARKLVELHDGLLWVKSNVDQGSTFHIALPFQVVVMSKQDA